ncbi:MAG: hypothetical protein ACFB00_13640 [Parvularculaceae bacterium]
MTTGGFGGEEIKQESSWRYPLGVFLATLLLSAILLYFYLGPGVSDLSGNNISPAVSEEPVELAVGDARFSVPANYTVSPRDRRAGAREELNLYALWPTFSGFTAARRDEFLESEPDGRRIDITIAARTSPFGEADRIDRLYKPNTTNARGARTSFQLQRYEFRAQRSNVPTNGYAESELYLGETADGAPIALFCTLEREDAPTLDCWREYELTERVSVIYRFKRPYLAEWRKIDADVRAIDMDLRIDDDATPSARARPAAPAASAADETSDG